MLHFGMLEFGVGRLTGNDSFSEVGTDYLVTGNVAI